MNLLQECILLFSSLPKKQWNDGHRGPCQAAGEIKAGDYMMVTSLVNRSELTASVARVIRWVEEEWRFEICCRWTIKYVSDSPGKSFTFASCEVSTCSAEWTRGRVAVFIS
jgi:hypothetical protein